MTGADSKKDRKEGGTQKEEDKRADEPAKASDKKPTGSTEKTEKKASQVIEKNDKKVSEPVGKTEKKGSELSQKKEEARPARQDEPLPGPSHRLDRDPRRGSSSPKKKKVIKITKPGRSGLVKGWRVQDIVAVCKEEGADDDADFRFVVKYKERDDMEAIPRQECNERIPHKVIKFYEMNVIWAQILEDL
ncbi:heterochromatin protein 1 isoform X1 [Folsomia candida]|uniref:heterochromatin protein 1 n=1 Tax=Folsomia candida TaxID=158441 RepID=UPI000B9000AE|nr:heterochromatin protein 1 [Folsomia candida]XP_021966618.1 heterochromatin protein 1 isoform X1 [Folsomia candida]XP_021966619.1 heterochromatin protein 1 isoform X1 [Folsomia candida]